MTARELIEFLEEYDEEIRDQKVVVSVEGANGYLLQIDSGYLDGNAIRLVVRGHGGVE